MIDKNTMINRIEDMMGSEGSREQATKFFDYCRERNIIQFSEYRGFYFDSMSDETFFELWTTSQGMKARAN